MLATLDCPCNNSYLLRVVSSVQQVSVPLQHVVCFSSGSDLLSSHSSEHLSSFVSLGVLVFGFRGLACFIPPRSPPASLLLQHVPAGSIG